MFVAVVAAAAVLLTPEQMSKIEALAAPIHDAYARVEIEQSLLAPAGTTREKLERLLPLDQAGREAFNRIDLAQIPADLLKPAGAVGWGEIEAHDQANELALRAILPSQGWFPISEYGETAAEAAFLVVQHSSNGDLQRSTLQRMQPLVGTPELNGPYYGLLYDRYALDHDHRPQSYGTQVVCRGGKWLPDNLDDPKGVDERRRRLGFDEPKNSTLSASA